MAPPKVRFLTKVPVRNLTSLCKRFFLDLSPQRRQTWQNMPQRFERRTTGLEPCPSDSYSIAIYPSTSLCTQSR